MGDRDAFQLSRTTRETEVHVRLGGEDGALSVAPPIFAHFLGACLKTWGIGADIAARGDVEVDPHHLLEDVGIVLGQALRGLVPGYREIGRYGFALVPMDDALAEVAIDLSGRSGAYLAGFPSGPVGSVEGEAFEEFFRGLSRGGECTLHVTVRHGENRHHCIEAAFKALGLALRQATAARPGLLSTKGVIG